MELLKKRNSFMSVYASYAVQNKVAQLDRLATLNSAHQVWGKDQKILRCNLLLLPTNKHYSVMLALGCKSRGKFTNGLMG
jgi:hypothetical protein